MVVYQWKHGYIPLTHTAAMSKAKGNKKTADKLLAKYGGDGHGSSHTHDSPPVPPENSSVSTKIDVQHAKDSLSQLRPEDGKAYERAVKRLDRAQSKHEQAKKYEEFHVSRPAPPRDKAIEALHKLDHEERSDTSTGILDEAVANKKNARRHLAYIDARKAGIEHREIQRHAPHVPFRSMFVAEEVLRLHALRRRH